MPTIPCQNKVECPCTDSPVSNYSAEDPDARRYLSRRWHSFVPKIDGDDSNTGTNYISLGCMGICYSEVSQQEADDCAAVQAVLCDESVTPFYNSVAYCQKVCPDGTLFYSAVIAGTVASRSQAEADALAYALACQRAAALRICLSIDNIHGCVGSYFTATITATSLYPVSFVVAPTTLPAGLLYAQTTSRTLSIFGTPTSNGILTFGVTAFGYLGSYATKTFSLRFLEITTSSPLAGATMGSPYSATMAAAGGSGSYTWALQTGTLPSGLALSTAGVISGTPTSVETASFTLSVCDNNF